MRRFLLLMLAVIGLAAPALAADMTKEQIDQYIHDYIMANPKVIVDSVNKYGEEQQKAEDEKASGAVKANMDWLTKNPNHAVAGNPNGDVTIVEFFDYNCGYCKQALSDIMTILDQDKGVKLIFVEIPILGESSYEAARWALAAKKQDKYLPFHIELMRHKGGFDAKILEDAGKKAGLDTEKLKADKGDPSFSGIMDENLKMASTLGISGTPAFVIGEQLVRGYVGLEGMKQAITEARNKKP